MPFKSKAQQAYICIHDKKLCADFASKTPKSAYANLPQYVGGSKKKKK